MTWLVLALAAALAWRVLSLWLWPYTACRRCDGGRRNPGSNSQRWGKCRGCGGAGERMRLGARAVQRAAARARRTR